MNLTHDQIVNIIEKSAGLVKSLKIRETSIEVVFVEPHKPTETTTSTQNLGYVEIPAPIDIPEDKNLNKNLSQGKTNEEVEDELLIEELHLTNPSAYEDLVALKEIKNVE
jgi:hypothetical protein